MRNRIALILLLLFCAGCGTYQVSRSTAERRVSRLLSLYPDIIDTTVTIERDTLVRLDTVYTMEHTIDTIFNILHDSVFVVQEGKVRTEVQIIDRERLKVVTRVEADTLLLRDTVFREIIQEVKVVPPVVNNKRLQDKPVFWLAVFLLLVLAMLLIYFKYKDK